MENKMGLITNEIVKLTSLEKEIGMKIDKIMVDNNYDYHEEFYKDDFGLKKYLRILIKIRSEIALYTSGIDYKIYRAVILMNDERIRSLDNLYSEIKNDLISNQFAEKTEKAFNDLLEAIKNKKEIKN
mgnify:CR=1 FL=1